jgi:acetyl esterase
VVDSANTPAYTAKVDRPMAERNTRKFLDGLNSSGGPPMETLSPTEARAVLTGAQQSVSVSLPPADISQKTISSDGLSISITVVRPAGAIGVLPAFMFFHGGGWVLGDFATHERLIRDLVTYSGAAAVYVDYSRSPEARYPVAMNEVFAATKWVAAHGAEIDVDGSRLAVVGNSVGGNLAAVVALRAKAERGPKLRYQVLFWPVTDARFDTGSYEAFQNDHFLTRGMMKWFWDSYTTSDAERNEIFASPLRATAEQLQGLPPAFVQTAELDVLRDEGEAYARKLDEAGVEVVSVRANGMIHDFGLLNPLGQVPSVQAALRHAGNELKRRLA